LTTTRPARPPLPRKSWKWPVALLLWVDRQVKPDRAGPQGPAFLME
jgi:hypothetical protein